MLMWDIYWGTTGHKMPKLTDTFVRSVKKPGKYGDQHGLILRVSASGTKQWIWRGRVQGRTRDLGLGGYPYITLKKARDTSLEYRQIARQGGDPSSRGVEVPTFRRVAERVIDLNSPKWKPGGNSEDQWRSSLETYVFPNIGAKPVDKVTSANVMACLIPIWHSRPTTAKRVLQRASTIMRWSIAQGFSRTIRQTSGSQLLWAPMHDHPSTYQPCTTLR